MEKIVFTQEIIDTFNEQEKQMFEAIKNKGVVENEGFDVQSYLAKKTALQNAEDEARKQLEAGFL